MNTYHETDAIGRAKELFDESDASGTGSVSKRELVSKLKADKQLESLLNMQDKDGTGVVAIMKLGVVIKQLEADGDGSISWAELKTAEAEVNPEDGVAPALSARAKALFEAAVVEANLDHTSSVSRRVESRPPLTQFAK